MTREAIVKAASQMETTHDLLVLLNKIKMDELGDMGHPFTMPQLNYFINPKRNKASYKTFFIPKRSGGRREISAPIRMLKSFQTYVNRLLQAFYDAPDCVTGFVPEKSVVDNAGHHLGMRFVFNADLKDFFPSITQARVWGVLKAKPFSFPESIASAIAGLCCIEVPGGDDGKPKHVLPQGSPCSPILTNIICRNLDRRLSGVAKRFQLRYTRYADDITFSSNHFVYKEDGEFITELRRVVDGQGFHFNDKKTRLQKRGERQEVTGLVVSDRANVAREYVRDLDNLIYIWEKYGHNAAFAKFIARYLPKKNLRNRKPDMNSVIQGRLMYLRMVKGEDCPVWRRLQKRFNRLVDRKESCGGTDIQYLHAYTVTDFEMGVGTTVRFSMELGYPQCSFTLNGSEESVVLGRYVKTRLKSILEGGREEDMKAFKSRYHIGFCHKEGMPDNDFFWMLFRRPPRAKKESLAIDESDEAWMMMQGGKKIPIAQGPTPPLTNTDSGKTLSTNETLDILVSSNFDLKTLDQWDKTKSS